MTQITRTTYLIGTDRQMKLTMNSLYIGLLTI
jgi:hypothetical protein